MYFFWLVVLGFNPFPHDKILDQTKLKAFADDKLEITKMIISVLDRVENIVGKGEIACTSNFSFSHNVFKGFLPKGVKRWEWVKATLTAKVISWLSVTHMCLLSLKIFILHRLRNNFLQLILISLDSRYVY